MDSLDTRHFRNHLSLRTYCGEYDAHTHEHAQVLVGLRGSLELEIDGHCAFVDARCGLVVPAGARHGYAADSAARVLVVDCVDGEGRDRVRRFAPPAQWAAQHASLTAEGVLSELCGAPALQARRRLDLDAVVRSIDAELHRPWTVEELAAICRFSPQRFRARFSELVGMPPLAFVRRRRLDAAERQLQAGMPLETVALQVGYASASALCFALRRDRGTGARGIRRVSR